MTIEKFTELVAKLNNLLQDPQPGLFMWNQAVNDIMNELKAYYSRGVNKP